MTVIWLAARELWISFRLLIVLGAFLAAGISVAVAARAPGDVGPLFAVAMALATVIAALEAAIALSVERGRGSAGWLVARAVPRGAILAAWFMVLLLAAAAGIVPAAAIAWLTFGASRLAPDVADFTLATGAAAASAPAALAAGMLAGATLSAPRAVIALAVALTALATVVVLVEPPAWVPGAGHMVLARVPQASPPVGAALQALGGGLVSLALLLAATRVAFARADL